MLDPTHRRQEPFCRIFGVNARFDRVTVDCDVVLQQRQPLSGSNAQLPLDEILSRDHLGYRMLDLEPRIHLHEIERIGARGIDDELDGARADVADRLRSRYRRFPHRAPSLRRHARRRRFLEHFLVSPLHRAVALEQIDAIAERVGEHLDLDVPRLRQVRLDQHAVVAEARLRLAQARRERGIEIGAAFDDAHSLPTTAGRRLDQHRVSDRVGFAMKMRAVLVDAVIAGNERHVGVAHQPFRFRLRSHRGDRIGRRTDERDARRMALGGELLVLR